MLIRVIGILATFVLSGVLSESFRPGKIPQLISHLGDNALITCDIFSVGNTITWKFQGKTLTQGDVHSRRQITENGTLLLIKNAQPGDSGIYECEDEVGKYNHIKRLLVGTPPERPTNLTCVTQHTLDSMSCCWDVGSYPGIATNFSMTYISRTRTTFAWDPRQLHSRSGLRGGCVKKETAGLHFGDPIPPQCCEIHLNDAGANHPHQINEFEFQLISINALGKVMSPNITERPLAWIRPSPPLNAKVVVKENGNFYSLVVTWDKPNMTIDSFQYQVRYRILGETESKWTKFTRISQNQYQFDLRRSHLLVEVQVAAWPTGLYGGYWSNWSKSAFNKTGESLPMSDIKVKSIVIEKTSDGQILHVEWFPYGRPQEKVFRNEITITDCKGEITRKVNVSGYESAYSINTNLSSCLEISSAFCNVGGCSEPENRIIQPKFGPPFSVAVSLKMSKKWFTVRWRSSIAMPEMCQVKILGVERDSTGSTATEVVAKKLVQCRRRQVSFALDASPCMNYSASVSSWKQEDVVYIQTSVSNEYNPPEPDIHPLEGFKVTAGSSSQLSASFLRNTNNCTNLEPRIFYTAKGGAECVDTASCGTEFMSKALDCNATKATLSSNVYGYTTYEVRYSMCCPRRRRDIEPACFTPEPNVAVTVQTPIGAPSSPVGVTQDGNEEGFLSWSKPIHSNGPLTGYLVNIKSHAPDQAELNVTTRHQSVNLSGVCEDINFNSSLNITIFAYKENEVGETLLGDPARFTEIRCTTAKVINQHSMIVIIVLVISTFLVLLGAILAYCQKERIKAISRKRFWPRLPRPNVVVTMQVAEANMDDDAMQLLEPATPQPNVERPTLTIGERCDDIRIQLLPTPFNSEPAHKSTSHQPNGNTGPGGDTKRDIDLMIFRNEAPSQGEAELGLKSPPPPNGRNNAAASSTPYSRVGSPSNRSGPTQTSTPRQQDGGRPAQPPGAENGHIPYSGDGNTENGGKNQLPGGAREYGPPVTSPSSEGYTSTTAPSSGSTLSLPSYLSCDNYTADYSTAGARRTPAAFMYTGVPDNYQWTLPEYTFTSSLYGPGSIQIPNDNTVANDDQPLEENPGRITFTIDDGAFESSIRMDML